MHQLLWNSIASENRQGIKNLEPQEILKMSEHDERLNIENVVHNCFN